MRPVVGDPALRPFKIVVVTDRRDLQKQLGETAKLTEERLNVVKPRREALRTISSAEVLQETLKRREARLGHEDIWTLQSMHGLADAYTEADRLDEAIPLFDEELKLSEPKFGPDHPETVVSRDCRDAALGRKWLQQKEYAKAEPLLHRNLWHIRRGDNWYRSRSESLLGESLLGQKKYAEAEPHLIGGYEGMKQHAARIPAQFKHYLTEAGERVVRLYEAWGKPEKAAEWRASLQPPAGAEQPKP